MNHTFIIYNAGGGEGFYHVEYNCEGRIVHVSGTLPTLQAAIGQAAAAGASFADEPLEYRSTRHDKEESWSQQ